MEADWMSLSLSNDPKSFHKWHTMREWISGVQLAAEPVDADEALVSKTIIDAYPDGIIFSSLDFLHMTGGIDLFLVTDHLLPADHIEIVTQILPYSLFEKKEKEILRLPATAVYLEHEWDMQTILAVREKGYQGGFCFHGSKETEIGMRDYSEMDNMIEEIRK
jgi:hypothetical protein